LALRDSISIAGGSCNEDSIGFLPHAAWVLDGATGLAPARVLPGPSDARWLVGEVDARLSASLRGDLARSTQSILREVVAGAAAAFERGALRRDVAPGEMPCACLLMARVIGETLELGNLGDCRLVHRGVDGAATVFGTSRLDAFDRAAMDEARRLRAADPSLTRAALWEALLPVIRAHRALMNQPNGYWILDLSERFLPHIETVRLPARAGDVLLLVSDGFHRLVELYGRYTYPALLEEALRSGLAALGQELIEDADEECRTHPRLKPRDDASALLVELVA
jgi:serine/threonine protein phosphatase PrpC